MLHRESSIAQEIFSGLSALIKRDSHPEVLLPSSLTHNAMILRPLAKQAGAMFAVLNYLKNNVLPSRQSMTGRK